MLRPALVATAVALVLAAPAGAATVPGQLVPVPPPGGCVGFWTLTFVGCATSSDLGASAVALSPDTRQLYLADPYGAVAIVQRDPTAGTVALDLTRAPCLVAAGVTRSGCQLARGISGATDVAVSPDGAFVYVSAWQNLVGSARLVAGSVAIFARDPETGALMQLPGPAGCLHQVAMPQYLAAGDETCADAPGMGPPAALALSPDGASLYVVDRRGAVQAFARDATAGTLTALGAAAPPAGMRGAVTGLSVAPDGAQVYVTRGGVAVAVRDATTGALSKQRVAARGRFTGPVAFGAAGATAYAAGQAAAVTALRRTARTGALRAVAGRRGCVAAGRTPRRRCSRTRLPVAGVISAGRFVYGFDGRGGVSAFAASGGGVRALPGRAGCLVTPEGTSRCTNTATGMYGVRDLVATPDGRFVYAVSALVTALSAAG